MSVTQISQNNYGFPSPIANGAPIPIISLRAPLTTDHAALGTIWVNKALSTSYVLVSIVSNVATWNLMESSGGSFTSLTVIGATSINDSGSANTSIGGGTSTGSVTIGAATNGAQPYFPDGLESDGAGILLNGGGISTNAAFTNSIITSNGAMGAINISATATSGGLMDLGRKRPANATVQTGDTVGSYIYQGWDGSSFVTGSQIISKVQGTVAATRVPSNIEFWTGTDAAPTVSTQRMTISDAGNVVVNVPDSGVGLSVSGGITAATGNVVLSTAAAFVQLPGPVNIMSGAGAPGAGLALHVGDMYINTTAASSTTRLYIATAASTWTNVTCAA